MSFTTLYGIPVNGNRLNFGHGGFWTGYSFMAARPLHPTVSAQFRLGVGVHYRIVTVANPEIFNLTNSDLSGPGALLTFKFHNSGSLRAFFYF